MQTQPLPSQQQSPAASSAAAAPGATHSSGSSVRDDVLFGGGCCELVVVRADAIWKREIPLLSWLVEPHAAPPILVPWYVGHVRASLFHWDMSGYAHDHLRVPMVCDAVVFVPNLHVPALEDALRRMAAEKDHLTHESLHFLPWYSRARVETLYGRSWTRDAHDSNPEKEWNPLYTLPGRAVSASLVGPWLRRAARPELPAQNDAADVEDRVAVEDRLRAPPGSVLGRGRGRVPRSQRLKERFFRLFRGAPDAGGGRGRRHLGQARMLDV